MLILDRVDGFTALTYWTGITCFWLRVAHALGMISGLARMPVRPILFAAGWLCCLIMAYSVFAAI
ncbi:MAPEG family protein [Pseudorhodobacter ferrugineus]|uniref:MAPEG family protein n=1 Tax=Pseudorhodobacter ferrugineus TaxID=77008 RepID=UPI001E501263|nr:MAPEG family protein [Pseudorhodobacter ferrugineus]